MKANKIDNAVLALSLVYIIFPIILFFFGWLKITYAFIGTVFFVLFLIKLYKKLTVKNINIINKKTILYWTFSLIVCTIWVYFSGIGSFSYQNDDFWVRNPIYRDLCNYDWPVIYDLSLQPSNIQFFTGASKVAFSYYYTWWLVPALFTKLFSLSQIGSNIALYVWSLLGILLVLYLINRILGKCSFKGLFVFIFFSGLDVVGNLIINGKFELFEHIEWWTNYFVQYSSNTTQLYWVFNQSIPLWIITAFALLLNDNKYIASICSISFAYSPWATIGIVPIAFIGSFNKKSEFKNVFNIVNISIPVIILITYGLFYFSSSGSSGGIGTTLSYYRSDLLKFIITLILFDILEFGLYILIVWKNSKKNILFLIASFVLLISPLVFMRDGNYTMRGTIPSLFILMVYVIKQLETKEFVNIFLIIFLFIGSLTAFSEINRSIYYTTTFNDYLQEEIGSFGNIKTSNKSHIEIIRDQFYIYNYQDSLFFRYLSK